MQETERIYTKKFKKALCCIAKNEDEYLQEWLDYHFKLGFDDIYVYQNNWRYKYEYEEPVGKHVHFIDFDGEVQQLRAYNHFFSLHAKDYDWCGVFDVDEFLSISSSRTLDQILSDYTEVPVLAVNWRLFGDSGHKKVEDSFYSLLCRFTKCEKTLNQHVKVIVNMNFIYKKLQRSFAMLNPHFGCYKSCNQEKMMFSGPFNEVNLDKQHELELNHYFCKTREEFKEKIARGRADAHSRRDNEEQTFNDHNKNEVENTTARDFCYGD